MNKITILSFLTLLFVSIHALAQIDQSKRLEYDLDKGFNYNVFAFSSQKSALVSYFQEDEQNKKQTMLMLELLDENFIVKKAASSPTPKELNEIAYYTDENFYYLFNYDKKTGDFLHLKIDAASLKIEKTEGSFNLKIDFEEFIALGKFAYISAIVKKAPVLFILDLETAKVKSVFSQSQTKNKLSYLDLEKIKTPTGYELAIQFSAYIKSNHNDIYLLRFDELGNQLNSFISLKKPDEETQLLAASLQKISPSRYIATGTYSKNKRGYSNGIYFANLDESGNTQSIKCYNFLDLKDFTSYLSERRQEKIEKKQEKKEAKGEELNLNYRITIHDLIEKDGQYIFLGEFFYPTYRTEYTTTYINGQATRSSYQVFDGFQYSHSVLASFDSDGLMKWSNTFEMWLNYKPYSVQQFVSVSNDDSSISLLFMTGSYIKSVSYDYNGTTLKDRTVEMVSTDFNGDKIKYSIGVDNIYWFGNNFLGSGTQKIKNEVLEDKKRKVFFINKISF